MSRNNKNNTELSKTKVNIQKANIIYDRLKSVYNISSDKKLGERLAGIGKSGMKYRRDEGKYDPDEIARAFPTVNRDWVFSDDLEDLRRLPVRMSGPKPQDADSVDKPKGGLSDQTKRELAEQIEEIARILKDSF